MFEWILSYVKPRAPERDGIPCSNMMSYMVFVGPRWLVPGRYLYVKLLHLLIPFANGTHKEVTLCGHGIMVAFVGADVYHICNLLICSFGLSLVHEIASAGMQACRHAGMRRLIGRQIASRCGLPYDVVCHCFQLTDFVTLPSQTS